jgi:hypothetical protein
LGVGTVYFSLMGEYRWVFVKVKFRANQPFLASN